MKRAAQILSIGLSLLVFLQACQQNQNTADKNNSNKNTGITAENVTPVQNGDFQNGIDTGKVSLVVIQDMNPIHVRTTYKTFNPDEAYYNEAISKINSTTWTLQEKTYEDVCKYKGKYMLILANSDGNMQYAVMMNEIIIGGLQENPYDIELNEQHIDTGVQAYLLDCQQDDTMTIYETQSTSIYDYVEQLGQAYQKDRAVTKVLVQSQPSSQPDAVAELQVSLKFQDVDLSNLNDRDQTLVELQNYLISCFNSEQPNLQQKLDPYSETDSSEFNYLVRINDQNNEIMYVAYISEGKTKFLDCLTGNCWISDSEQIASDLQSYIDNLK